VPLPLTVGLVVFGALVLFGLIGYLIDASAERHQSVE